MAPRIALYGATGYTGHLVARELARRGHEPVLCGRSAEKLRRMAADLGVGWETRSAEIDDAPALRRALDGADVVISCAGPFTYYGAPVIEAAIDVGAHYLDTTGEQPYMQRVYEHLDAPARARGVAVLPAMGFDYVPGDLIAALAARGHEPLEVLEVAYAVSSVAVTRGTMRSVIEMLAGEGLEYAAGSFRPAGTPPMGERFDFGGTVGEQPVMQYPGGEVVTVPRHVRTRSVRLRWATPPFVPAAQLAPLLPAAVPIVGALLRTPLTSVLDAVIGRLPEGPEEDAPQEPLHDHRRGAREGRERRPGRGARRGRLRPDRRDHRARRRAAVREGLRGGGRARPRRGVRPGGVLALPRRARRPVRGHRPRAPARPNLRGLTLQVAAAVMLWAAWAAGAASSSARAAAAMCSGAPGDVTTWTGTSRARSPARPRASVETAP